MKFQLFATSSLSTPKALSIPDNTVSNYPPTCLILRVVYYQFCKARLAHTKRESLDTICITLEKKNRG